MRTVDNNNIQYGQWLQRHDGALSQVLPSAPILRLSSIQRDVLYFARYILFVLQVDHLLSGM